MEKNAFYNSNFWEKIRLAFCNILKIYIFLVLTKTVDSGFCAFIFGGY